MVARINVVAFVGSLGLFGVPSVAAAADWYVDAASPAGGNGSMGSPFTDLQDGLDAAMPGDTVFVLPGDYDSIASVRDGSRGQRITVMATQPRQARIMADGTGLELGHSHHTFEGLVIDCGYGSGDCIEGGTTAIELVDLEVRRSSRDCIDLRNSSDILVEAADIHHCIAPFDPNNNADAHGITGDSVFDLTVRDSSIRWVTGDSIQLSPGRDAWGGLLVESSVLTAEPLAEDTNGWSAGVVIGENAFDSKVGGSGDGSGQRPTAIFRDVVASGWRGPISNASAFNVKEEVDFRAEGVIVSDSEIAFRLRGPAQSTVMNAVVFDVDVGFRMEDDIESPRVFNTTIGSDVERVFTEAGGDVQGPQFRNMLFLAAEVPELAASESSNLAVDGSVFVDADSDDYHLIEGSSPMDAGIDIADVTRDLDGVARPTGDAYDIGAYEWTDMPPGSDTDDGSGGATTDGGDDSDSGAGSGGSDGGDSDAGGDSSDGDDGSGSSSGAGAGGEGGGTGLGDTGDTGCSCRADAGGGAGPWLLGLVALLGLRARRRRAATVATALVGVVGLAGCDAEDDSDDPFAGGGSTTAADNSGSGGAEASSDGGNDSDEPGGSSGTSTGGPSSTTDPTEGSTGASDSAGPMVDPAAHAYFEVLAARPDAQYSNPWRSLEDIQLDVTKWGEGPSPPTYDPAVDAARNEMTGSVLEGRDQLHPEFDLINTGDVLFYWETRWDADFPEESEAYGVENHKTFVLRQNSNMGEKRMLEIRNRFGEAEAPDISTVDFRGYGGGWEFDGDDSPLDGQTSPFVIAPESWTRYWVYCDFESRHVDVWISDETREPIQILSKTFNDMADGVRSVKFQFNSSQERTGGDPVDVWNRNFVMLRNLETNPQTLINLLEPPA